MGLYDCLRDVPDGYDNQVKCWPDKRLRDFGAGDVVPDICGYSTYSVRLHSWEDDPPPPRYLCVVDGKLTDVANDHPHLGAPVFDKWGDLIDAGQDDLVNRVDELTRLYEAEHKLRMALEEQVVQLRAQLAEVPKV